MTLEQLLKTREPSFWSLSARTRGLQVKHLLRYLDAGGDINARGPNGWTLIHYAAEDQNVDAIKLLASRGAEVNARDTHRGYAPLHLAVDSDCDTAPRDGRRASELPTVRALIEAGADESIRANDGQIPRDLAIACGPHETTLYDAVSRLHRPHCDLANIDSHLMTDLAPDAIDPLLASWRWLIGDTPRALFVTAGGDAFLIDAIGRILWLNTGDGTVTPVADSLVEFQSLLQSRENRENLFFAPAIDRLRESGQILAPGQCYGFVTLPVLGGDWEGENRFPVSVKEHLDLTGHIHEQIKDLPDGAEVRVDIVD